MERARLAFFVAVAFFAAALLAVLAFSEDAPLPGLGSRGASRIVIEVENVGTHAAQAVVQLSLPEGGGVGHWNVDVPFGSTSRVYQADPPAERLVLRVTLSYDAGPGESGRGDYGAVVDPRECEGGDRVVHVVADTTEGVVFGASSQACR